MFPAGKKLGWRHHPVINYGVLVQGELTIIGQNGKEKVVQDRLFCGTIYAVLEFLLISKRPCAYKQKPWANR